MEAHNNKGLLKYGIIAVVIIVVLILILPSHHAKESETKKLFSENTKENKNPSNTAANDSAAESLDTLTAELSTTKQQVEQITKDNQDLKKQNEILTKAKQDAQDATIATLSQQVAQLKNQIQPKSNDYVINTQNASQPIGTVPDLAQFSSKSANRFNSYNNNKNSYSSTNASARKPKTIPYYTIPANATAVHDRLMTALVGRIPIKGVVTDPYPFKIVFSDDTLAANGLRVPNLKKMIVSGYSEGDLNLVSARGWVTSLTFVFNDGRISTTTSNANDIGHFTKDNALGYLSDPRGNPFIRGKLITNAPEFLAGTVSLGAAQGFAGAFAAAQTTSTTNIIGGSTTTVTGSPYKYAGGQAGVGAASAVQQWWQDREENSFDAIYVPSGQEIVVNFAKEIDIDYNPKGRKLDYANRTNPNVSRYLD